MIRTPPLLTASLALRRFTLDDAPALLAMSHERGLREWLPDQVYADEAHAREVARYLIAQYDLDGGPGRVPLVLGVARRDTGALIGHVGLSPLPGGVEVGYAIADAHQGRGLATLAVRAMVTWGFERFGLPAVDGIVASDNVGSCRVLEKAGFERVAEVRRSLHGVSRVVRTYRAYRGQP